MNWDVNASLRHLRMFANQKSKHLCAQYTREAIEVGLGMPIPRSRFAKDYGIGLQVVGFIPLLGMSVLFKPGDVAIIDGLTKDAAGHMAMFDGTAWISDFRQNDYPGREGGLYPGPAYANQRPRYTIYRWRGLM